MRILFWWSLLLCLVMAKIICSDDYSWKPDDMRDGETFAQYFERRNRESRERLERRKKEEAEEARKEKEWRIANDLDEEELDPKIWGKSDRELYQRLVRATNSKLMAFEIETIPTLKARIQTRIQKIQEAQTGLEELHLQESLDAIKQKRKEIQDIVEMAEEALQKKSEELNAQIMEKADIIKEEANLICTEKNWGS